MDDRILDTLASKPFSIQLNPEMWELMKSHAQQGLPEEVCGVITGHSDQEHYRAVKIYPITNILHSTHRFRMDPHEQLQAFNELEEMGLELIGIYHSHPKGPAFPSDIDLEEAYYPECAYLIWSPEQTGWSCRCFRLESGKFIEIALMIE